MGMRTNASQPWTCSCISAIAYHQDSLELHWPTRVQLLEIHSPGRGAERSMHGKTSLWMILGLNLSAMEIDGFQAVCVSNGHDNGGPCWTGP